jgi:hypothetical protein
MADDVMHLDFGDGVSALDRVMRSITMMMAGAIAELETLGYDRNKDEIDVELPEGDEAQWHVKFRGRRIFTVEIDRSDGISVEGRWTQKPSKKTLRDRIFGWKK